MKTTPEIIEDVKTSLSLIENSVDNFNELNKQETNDATNKHAIETANYLNSIKIDLEITELMLTSKHKLTYEVLQELSQKATTIAGNKINKISKEQPDTPTEFIEMVCDEAIHHIEKSLIVEYLKTGNIPDILPFDIEITHRDEDVEDDS